MSHAIFRLAVVNAEGKPAAPLHLLTRWAIVWLPLFLPLSLVVLLIDRGEHAASFISALALFLLWVGAAAYTVVRPHRGLQDQLAHTWVVRR